MKIKTGIIGASGYTGAELLRLLHNHPNFEVLIATAESQAGKAISEVYPHLQAYKNQYFYSTSDVANKLTNCQVIFCGLPHGKAANILSSLDNEYIIDLGSDFRLKNPAHYDKWYSRSHPCPEVLPNWTYGLPELFYEEISNSKRIANPGCYATAVLLSTIPLAKKRLITGPIVVDAISGTSGAGKVPKPSLHFPHVFEDVRAYKIAAHQHTPEIEMILEQCGNKRQTISMTAHLAPTSRGIHAICSASLNENLSTNELDSLYKEMYAKAPFVHITDSPPGTKEVRGSNYVHINVSVDDRNKRVVTTCVIDNLVKGAAGQAIQNANILLGLKQTTGLEALGVYP